MRIPRTPQQVVIERRHQVEGGDPLGLDQAERAVSASKRGWQTKAPHTGAMASRERTPMVW